MRQNITWLEMERRRAEAWKAAAIFEAVAGVIVAVVVWLAR